MRNYKYYKYNISIKILILIIILTILPAGSLLIYGCKSINAEGNVIQISPEKVYKIISEKKDYLILDVRTKEEFDAEHLESATLIPVDELEARLGELPKDKPIIVYCMSGRRSTKASEILIKNHFSPVYNMAGGIEAWKKGDYPLIGNQVSSSTETKGSANQTTQSEPSYNIIGIDEVFEIVNNNQKDYQIIDVRSSEDYKMVHIKNAISIPASELEDRLTEIPKDKSIIVYCDSSACGSSGMAAQILVENGFENVYAMDSGIDEWLEKKYPVSSE